MKRIGILTFHNAINYGAVLQTFALQRKVLELNSNCEVINYDNDYFKKIYSTNPFSRGIGLRKRLSIVYHFLRHPLNEIRENKKAKSIKRFAKKYISFSKVYNHNDMKALALDYEGIIVGSDQVWNMRLSNYDTTYFLEDIANIKKYSYAASFGKSNITGFEYEKILKCLPSFERITVREETAKRILLPLRIESSVVLDPTFLLDYAEWKNLLSIKEVVRKKYVLVYTIQDDNHLLKEAETFAEKFECEIISLSFFNHKKYTYKNDSSISDFVALIHAAECIFTTSFHGLAFSIISHKNFYFELSKKTNNNNSRMSDLCNELGLSSREIKNQISEYVDIDYAKVDARLQQLKEHSLLELKRIVDSLER